MGDTERSEWSEPLPGPKGQQRKDSEEDRALPYRQWCWNLGGGCYNSDLDWIVFQEGIRQGALDTSNLVPYRFIPGELGPVPIAIIEITRPDEGKTVNAKYLSRVDERMANRDAQRKFILTIGRRLDCEVWVVVFANDLKDFWVRNLGRPKRGWVHHTEEEHKAFHRFTMRRWHNRYHGKAA